MQRVYALNRSQQLQVYANLRDYLGADAGRETAGDRQAARRGGALSALESAARYLGLDDRAPNSAEFSSVPDDARLGWTVGRVIGAWGRWKDAAAAFEGRWVPETPAQRALRSSTSGRRRTSEDYLTSVRSWLDELPGSATVENFDIWARDANDRRSADELPHVTADGIRFGLGLQWADILAVARGEATYDDRAAQVLAAARLRVQDNVLITTSEAGLIAGVLATAITGLISQGRFPMWVAKIGRTRLWVRDDVIAQSEGRPFPIRKPGEMQAGLLTARDVARRLGVTVEGARGMVWRQQFHLVPPPDGRAGKDQIWFESSFVDWYEHDYAKGPKTPRPSSRMPNRPAKRPPESVKSPKSSR